MPQQLLIDGLQGHRIFLHSGGDPVGQSKGHNIGVTNAEVQGVALGLNPVTHPLHQQFLLKPFLHPDHHIVDQRPGQTGKGAGALGVIPSFHQNYPVGLLQGDLGPNPTTQFAFGTGHGNLGTLDIYFNCAGHFNRLIAYSGHFLTP